MQLHDDNQRAGDAHIAGWKTQSDWRIFRKKLVVSREPELWKAAFSDWFKERLELRYLHPVRVLQENGSFRGEGFSILVIQCSLIEFIESTLQGITYRYLRRGERLGSLEYSSSSSLFSQFLTTRKPFADEFDRSLAEDFYSGVRCALLHEARTRNGWTVWAKSPSHRIVDPAKKIVYRDHFQASLEQFIEWYGGALQIDKTLQDAFIRKFDSLAE